MARTFPARLHVILASRAPVGVVFRRGPANTVGTFLWDRRTDEFSQGQWLRSRIYERRADLSPEGRYLIYFARGNRRSVDTNGPYTAISRAPWLKAIALFAKGDCWQGGGIFTAANKYWLNGCHMPIRESKEVAQDTKYLPAGNYGGECPGVYYRRLQRDGWVFSTRLGARFNDCAVFEKMLPRGWILRKLAHEEVGAEQGRGCYWDEHELESARRKKRLEFGAWEWADRDGDMIVWAEAGRLYRASFDHDGPGEPVLLQDFNGMKFDAVEAPY